MVGVPGKYKGCNTCRSRRIKCDNERPLCRKCIESGRECLGYERETVFIIGTVQDKGRCSSHPPRNMRSPKKPSSPAGTSEAGPAVLFPVKPLCPAWVDQLHVTRSRSTIRLKIVAIHVPLGAVARSKFGDTGATTSIFVAPSSPMDVGLNFQDTEFKLRSQCLLSISPAGEEPESATMENVLLFLFEHNSPLTVTSYPVPAAQANRVRLLGPAYFQTFPSHHFFARVYRPSAITTALLNRVDTFCAELEWTTLPFALHHKSSFDRLLDIMAQIAPILPRIDYALTLGPTMARRRAAQQLLGNCLIIQAQLEQWHFAASDPRRPRHWFSEDLDAHMPFLETFSFQDPLASLTLTYYWAAQVLFVPCLETLVHTILAPVVDAYPQAFPDLPPQLSTDPASYSASGIRCVAADVCRGLDHALMATSQPDMLSFPVSVVERFYARLVNQVGEGALELMWLGAFRGRMALRAQDIAGDLMARDWVDLVEW